VSGGGGVLAPEGAAIAVVSQRWKERKSGWFRSGGRAQLEWFRTGRSILRDKDEERREKDKDKNKAKDKTKTKAEEGIGTRIKDKAKT